MNHVGRATLEMVPPGRRINGHVGRATLEMVPPGRRINESRR